MGKKTSRIFLYAVIFGLAILAIAAFFLFRQKKSRKEPADLNYAQVLNGEESKPLAGQYPERSAAIPILMYHHVGQAPAQANPVRRDMTVSASEFEAQAAWLKKAGYGCINLQNLFDFSRGNFVLPDKPVIFTFDDGYADVFENAVPVLKKYGFTGSFAIITRFAGQTQGDNAYASWPSIAKAFDQGMEIVSHTQNHFDGRNPKFSSEYIFQNLDGSISDIYARLGIKTGILIYPYGHYTPDYITQAKAAGFFMGITVHEGKKINLDNLMEIPRLRVHGSADLEKFKNLVEG